ncbi:MAG: nitroreductase [Oscillospiraceae bacterium]|nr:MAG: nitroreductase [Oscillospiraceae bacterium]
MEWNELLKKRESCRVYRSDPVPHALLEELVASASRSPSGCNAQPWRFIIIDEPQARAKLIDALDDDGLTGCPWGEQVPAFVVICEVKATLKPLVAARYESQRFAQMDIGMAAMTFCYAATDRGLGSCMIGTFHEQKLRDAFGIPPEAKPRLIITVGYDKLCHPPRNKIRKPFEEICSCNHW